jgi:small subunit ribosomal protein S9
MNAPTKTIHFGLGRRKSSVARVRLLPGKGRVFVNSKTIEEYFNGLPQKINDILKPLEVTKSASKFDIKVVVKGGGITGQAEAVRLGIARALSTLDDSNKVILRKNELLTRDSREVERKKPGQPKARKRFQYSKR